MARGRPIIAFDFSGLDHLHFGNGQFRYCVDLLHGLALLNLPLTFLVLGSGDAPVAAIADVCGTAGWDYARAPQKIGRGRAYLAHLEYGWLLRRRGAAALHVPHTFVPLWPGTRLIVTIYDMMQELFPEYAATVASRPYRLFRYGVQRLHPQIIAISRCTATDLQRLWNIPSSSISVVPLCVSPTVERTLPESRDGRGWPDETQRYLLSPYNLEPRKNLESLIRAFAGVRHAHPDLQLLLYGRAAVTTERERRFQQLVDELQLTGCVKAIGFVEDHELAALYAGAEAFVFPSLYEGFGLPVLEAMAAGACTIARNTSAMAEVLADTGALVDTGKPELLAGAIEAVLSDAPRRRALGAAAKARAAAFTRQAMAERTAEVYIRTLNQPI